MIRRKFENSGSRHYKLIIIDLNEVSTTSHNDDDDALIEQALTKMINAFYDE